jgi:predicted GIY-YIG superfamily endonuclease
MKQWKVYVVLDETGRYYVGCTSQRISKRMIQHKCRKKEFAMRKNSVEIILETDSYDKAKLTESEVIRKLDSTNKEKGYNRRFGDQSFGFPKYVLNNRSQKVIREATYCGSKNPMFGRKQSQETKEKIRKKALERDYSNYNFRKTPEHIENLKKSIKDRWTRYKHPMLGRSQSEEAKKKISEANKGHKRWLGRKHSEESKKKMSESKRKNSPS